MKKNVYCLALMLLGMFVLNAQNLLKNGDFKNGTQGWFLNKFNIKSEGDIKYVVTPRFASGVFMMGAAPSIKTNNQVVPIKAGNKYVFSFWGKGLDTGLVAIECMFKDSDGYDDDDLGSEDGVKGIDDWNMIHLEEKETKDGWTKFEKEIFIPKSVDVKKMTWMSIQLSPEYGAPALLNKAVRGISFELKSPKPKIVPPAGFSVVQNMLTQRSVQFTWKTMEGKTYKIDMDNHTYDVAQGKNICNMNNLMPNTEYTAQIYTTANPKYKATVKFTTKGYIENMKENRIPFLGNIMDEQLPKTFVYHIDELSGDMVTDVKIMFGGVDASIAKDGLVTLPDGVSKGKLVVKLTQKGGEETTLTYDSITVKQ